MSEENKDVGLEIKLNGEGFLLTRYNTTLFTFWGRVILRDYELDAKNFDHVFIQTSDEDAEQLRGAYLFRYHPMFKKLAKFAIEHNFPRVINQVNIPECDVRAFEQNSFGDLATTETVPEDWLNGSS